jgi:poly [ADP-ribose] polymerase
MADFKAIKYKDGLSSMEKTFPGYEVVEHKIGNQTNPGENNNKFFSAELLKLSNGKWAVFTNYGRVGVEGVYDYYGPSDESDMRAMFAKKCKDKLKPSEYTEVKFIKATVGSPKAKEKSWSVPDSEIPDAKKKKLVESAAPNLIIKSLHADVERLINQWFDDSTQAIQSNSAIEITKDGLMTPLGVLTFSQLEKGKEILGNLVSAVKADNKDEIRDFTGQFYSTIPTRMGRKITEADYISTDIIIQQKIDLLEMMTDALEVGGKTFVSNAHLKYQELGVDLAFLNKDNAEWKRLEKKVQDSRGNGHGIRTKVFNILKVIRPPEQVWFGGCKIDNELELFHGSRNSNIPGILKTGLRIAPKEAPVSGYAFDKGLYFAKHSTKSLNYSVLPFPNMRNAKNCFLFIVKVKLGKQLIKPYGSGDELRECKKGGFDSTWGKPSSNGHSVMYDEFIVYDVAQQQLDYIIELER